MESRNYLAEKILMNEMKPVHHRFENPNGAELHHSHGPYWKRAHRDWRIWFCVIAMLVAMFVYLATGDLRWRLQAQPQSPQPISAPAGN
jgi:hypothetical protein